uniref:HNH endonuclease n=1 Tax=uncultured Thiotrichaceae bacterium TaxID=298394 RepID=A0A6S6STQ0_9GAMM|nr:MAG: HNH endonuclease [uncultured Thiotrichaceae bacterium]
MSNTYISASLRREVVDRADAHCEYCLIHEEDTFFGCHIDHIISEKHGGLTQADNLALACTFCNLHKGSDIASLSAQGKLTPLYNPRNHNWHEHFELEGALIKPITDIGEVTVKLLQFNGSERVLERETLLQIGHYLLPNQRKSK